MRGFASFFALLLAQADAENQLSVTGTIGLAQFAAVVSMSGNLIFVAYVAIAPWALTSKVYIAMGWAPTVLSAIYFSYRAVNLKHTVVQCFPQASGAARVRVKAHRRRAVLLASQ